MSSIPPHSLCRLRREFAPEHSTLLGCFSRFLSSYFFSTSHHSHQLSLTLCLLRHPPPHPPPLVSLLYFVSDEGRVQQEVHLHLYHTCNVLSALTAGLSSVVSTCHFGSRTPVIPGPHPKAHFTRCTRGAASNATCPDYRLATICTSSPCSKKHRHSLKMFVSSPATHKDEGGRHLK